MKRFEYFDVESLGYHNEEPVFNFFGFVVASIETAVIDSADDSLTQNKFVPFSNLVFQPFMFKTPQSDN